MSEIRNSINRITSLEVLAQRNTPLHRIHPAIKLLVTAIYLIIVISYGAEQISGLIVFFFYPILLMTVGEIPFKALMGRILITLPFTVFAGLSNMLVSREAAMVLGGIVITKGMVVFLSILIKTVLTVTAVLILIASTTMTELLYAMLYFHIPSIIVLQITMTFRYLSVLMEEVLVMYHAYILRAPREHGIKLFDMGPFLGQLIIRSFDQADRIYHAMKCRGFEGGMTFTHHKKVPKVQWLYLAVIICVLILLRLFNVSAWIGSVFVSFM
jgi:cobalt/nickel transport system permease protein